MRCLLIPPSHLDIESWVLTKSALRIPIEATQLTPTTVQLRNAFGLPCGALPLLVEIEDWQGRLVEAGTWHGRVQEKQPLTTSIRPPQLMNSIWSVPLHGQAGQVPDGWTRYNPVGNAGVDGFGVNWSWGAWPYGPWNEALPIGNSGYFNTYLGSAYFKATGSRCLVDYTPKVFSVLVTEVSNGPTAKDVIGFDLADPASGEGAAVGSALITYPICEANPTGGPDGILQKGHLEVQIESDGAVGFATPICGIGVSGSATGEYPGSVGVTLAFPQLDEYQRQRFIPTDETASPWLISTSWADQTQNGPVLTLGAVLQVGDRVGVSW